MSIFREKEMFCLKQFQFECFNFFTLHNFGQISRLFDQKPGKPENVLLKSYPAIPGFSGMVGFPGYPVGKP